MAPRGKPQRNPEELEKSWIAAYELRCEGKNPREIAAMLAGPPHFCGGASTARDWIRNGLEVVAEKGDDTRKRRARREMALDALDKLRVQMDQDLEAGLMARPGREAYYKLQRQYILDAITIAGAQAPRALPRVKRPDGSKTPATAGEMIDDLAVMRSEFDEVIERMLPERTE